MSDRSLRANASPIVIAVAILAALLIADHGPRHARAQEVTPKPATEKAGGEIKHEMAICSGEEVFMVVFNYDPAKRKQPVLATKTWSWKARDCKEIDKKFKTSFMMTSECKPVDGGKKMIITAKEGGVALVDRDSGKALFHAVMNNRGYSGDLLPNDRLAIVSGDEKSGHVSVYDLKSPARPMFQQALLGARGIVWDAEREILWAIGFSELRQYKLALWNTPQATLRVEQSYKLPSEDGHDLQLVPARAELMLTTAHGLWRFDIEKRRFAPDQVLGSRDEIKSVSMHPQSRLLAYVHEENQTWWSQRVRLVGADSDLLFPNSRIYKARWVMGEGTK